MVLPLRPSSDNVKLSVGDKHPGHPIFESNRIHILHRQSPVRLPVLDGAEGVLEQTGERGAALRAVEAFVTGVAIVLELPAGRWGELIDETVLGAGQTAGTFKGRGGLAGAVAGGD